jgi:hypothetical protein
MLTLHQPIHRQQQFHPQFRFKPINLLGSDIEACLQSMSGKPYHKRGYICETRSIAKIGSRESLTHDELEYSQGHRNRD